MGVEVVLDGLYTSRYWKHRTPAFSGSFSSLGTEGPSPKSNVVARNHYYWWSDVRLPILLGQNCKDQEGNIQSNTIANLISGM